jgi:hypothetical protein
VRCGLEEFINTERDKKVVTIAMRRAEAPSAYTGFSCKRHILWVSTVLSHEGLLYIAMASKNRQ